MKPPKLFNTIMQRFINSPLGALAGEGMAVITVTGRKSGKEISTPINVARFGDSYKTLSSRERTWWRNMRGGASAKLRTGGKTFTVKGEVFETDEEVRQQLIAYLRQRPQVARFLGIQSDAEGNFDQADLTREVSQRVVIFLHKQ